MLSKTIHYEDPAQFLKEYNRSLRHQTLMVAWEEPPPVSTLVHITLHLLPDGRPLTLAGTITTISPGYASVALEALNLEQRTTLEQSVQFCQSIVEKMSGVSMAALPAAPKNPPPGPMPRPAPRSDVYQTASSGGLQATIPPTRTDNPIPPNFQSFRELNADTSEASGYRLPPTNPENPVPPQLQRGPRLRQAPPPPEHRSPFMATSTSSESSDSMELLLPTESSPELPAPKILVPSSTGNPPPTSRVSPPQKPSPHAGSRVNLNESRADLDAPSSAGMYPAVTEQNYTGSGSWVALREEPEAASPTNRDWTPPDGGQAVSWLTRSRFHTKKKEFQPSPEDWQHKEIYSPQENLWSHTDIPELSDWTSSEQMLPSESPSTPDLPAQPTSEMESSAEISASLGYAAPVISPPPLLHSSMELPAATPPPTLTQALPQPAEKPISEPAPDEATATPAPPSAADQQNKAAATSPSRTGTLQEIPLLQLLSELSQRSANGYLEVRCPEATLQCYLYKGGVMYTKVEPVDESTLLGAVLVRQGRINVQEKERALRKASELERPLGEVMYEDDTITKRELASALRYQMQRRLGAFAEYTEGTFEYWDQRMPKHRLLAPPTSPIKLLFRDKIESLSRQPYEVAQEIEELHMDRFLFPAEDAQERIQELGLTSEEEYFWEQLITGQFRLREVYAASNFRHRRTYTLIFALEAFGYLVFKREQAREWQIVEMREKFQARFMLLGHETFFELLGVHWSSSREEVEQAYLRIQQDYDINNYPGEWPEDIHKMSQSILEHLEKVRKHLRNKGDRREYRSDVHHTSKLLFSADLLEQQGDMAIFRRDFADAIERYSRALEINPNLPAVQEKLKQSKAAHKKFREHIKANEGKNIDYEARLRVNASHLGVKDEYNK